MRTEAGACATIRGARHWQVVDVDAAYRREVMRMVGAGLAVPTYAEAKRPAALQLAEDAVEVVLPADSKTTLTWQ